MTDAAVADDAATDRSTRRALLGAGVVGAAFALAAGRPASATPGLPQGDLDLLGFAISLELTARDLYDAAVESGATGTLWTVLREQHESAAQLLAGVAGISAQGRDDTVFDAFTAGFTSSTTETALELENVAAATHSELLASVSDDTAASAVASIASIENRHATVLAGLAGLDADALLSNTAEPLSPEA